MIIFGNHSCRNAIENAKSRVRKVYIQNGKTDTSWLPQNCPVIYMEDKDFTKLVPPRSVHQGIAVDIDESIYFGDISDLSAASPNQKVIILDNITDPHNFGAIIRTAAVFGISGIIFCNKSSCGLTGTVLKAACGGIEHVMLYEVKNLATTLKKLKDYGFWIVSFCEKGNTYLHEIDLKGKMGLIFGSEGDGIRRLQKENSDFVVKLPTSSNFSTLNVSNAVAVACYEISRQHNFCL